MEAYDEFEEYLEEIVNQFANMPLPEVQIINPQKYRIMRKAMDDMGNILEKEFTPGKVHIRVNRKLNIGQVVIDVPDLSIRDLSLFKQVLADADILEIYSLRDGGLRMELSFREAFIEIE